MNFEKCQEINSQMDDAILKVGNKIELIESNLIIMKVKIYIIKN